jgi:mono/diheme cytochrome c family protein
VTLADPPPPLSGGTLAISEDKKIVVAADPDRDRVHVVTLEGEIVKSVDLTKHDEPGRVALDDGGRAHVVLRRGGAVVTIDLASAAILARRAVCAAPRGIAFDAARARLVVACESGELFTMGAAPDAADAAPSVLARLDDDLRDVVVSGDRIYVTRFRAAELLALGSDGAVAARTRLMGPGFNPGEGTLAWRMVAAPPDDTSADPIVVHESATQATVAPQQGGYGTPAFDPDQCTGSGGILTSLVTRGRAEALPLPSQAVLPVDIALAGDSYAVVAAGNAHTPELPQLYIVSTRSPFGQGGSCQATHMNPAGQITSVVAGGDGKWIVQSREPAQLQIMPYGGVIPLGAPDSREDTGHAIFHSNTGAGIACASCHGEGRDDGHVWTFDGSGPRRTPSLLGTIKDTAPYHWNGEMLDISMLVDEVMTLRMSGPLLDGAYKDALQSWLFALPAPAAPAPSDPAAVARGKALFESSATGCTTCHTGPMLTTALTVDVGTGGSFQVPSLIGVGERAPYLHDGCAATLEQRFDPSCGGSKHGTTSQLAPAEIADMVAYLKTL